RAVGEERELLVDDADAVLGGLPRGVDGRLLAVELDRARVGPDGSGEDLHQGRLAGAVLADDGVDRAAAGLEAHVQERLDAAVPFREAADRDGVGGRAALALPPCRSFATCPHSPPARAAAASSRAALPS